jgi:hypothetical protein
MIRRYEIGTCGRIVPEFGLLSPTAVGDGCHLRQDA